MKNHWIYLIVFGLIFASMPGQSKILLLGGTADELLQLRDFYYVKDTNNIETVNNGDEEAKYKVDITQSDEMAKIPTGYEVIYYSFFPDEQAMASIDNVIPKLGQDGIIVYSGGKPEEMRKAFTARGFTILPDVLPPSLAPVLTEEEYNELLTTLGIEMPENMRGGLKNNFFVATKSNNPKSLTLYLSENDGLLELLKRTMKGGLPKIGDFLLKCAYEWRYHPAEGRTKENALGLLGKIKERIPNYYNPFPNIANPENARKIVKEFIGEIIKLIRS